MEQTFKEIRDCLARRILIMDGAMGTRIQAFGLSAESFHRGRFASWPVSLAGNNDVLCLTAPEVIKDIHRLYIEAGADIIATNTFSSNRISQQEYGCAEIAHEMAREGARLAREVADSQTLSNSPLKGENSLPLREGWGGSSRKIYVAGSMGPTSKSLTLPSDMGNPSRRLVSFDEMVDSYAEQAEALLEGGADMLLLETCYDALNTKAAIYAISKLNERFHREIPVMVSVTVNDRSGRTLTGQTLWAFYTSISHYPYLLSFGLNCSFGVTDLRPFVEQLSANVPLPISIYPNAGLPNQMGEYEELPDYTASHLRQMAEAGLLNIAGGCCGTDEHHIKAISEALRDIRPRFVPEKDTKLRVSGLEPLLIDRQEQNFTNVGERTNVAGSRRFARLIAEKQYGEALSVARNQIEGGATVIDINMDDAMLDSREEMQTFCRHISGEPAVGRAVLMIDSSDWPTILAGLKNAQGKCIVNSISLKAGEQDFLAKALELRRIGAAVVVMAFDEEGQAITYERKIAIAERAYKLLTSMGFPPQDIIFDANILSVGTGIKEHQAYAVDFIRAVEWIKQHLPYSKTSGGVSNLSFAFRGNNKVREAMHSVFLYHAIRAGLDMAIVNPSMLQVYDDIEPCLLRAVEDVILNSDDEATERLLAESEKLKVKSEKSVEEHSSPFTLHSSLSIEERLQYALTKGDSSHLAEDIPEALAKYGEPIHVIEGPLMQAMERIGQLFGEGKMFLPQVVRSAQVMKDAVAILTDLPQPSLKGREVSPFKGESEGVYPCVVLATANGDVHDIGKNIVSIVLSCNGFEVIDLGVMVPCETILEATRQHKPMLVGISGLITPSLKEMEKLCETFQREHLQVPILVGGATTSAVHTAVKLAPLYDGLVLYGGDASQTSVLAKRLDSPHFIEQIKTEQQQIRDAWSEHHAPLTPYHEANRRGEKVKRLKGEKVKENGSNSDSSLFTFHFSLKDLKEFIDWRMFLLFWGFKGETLPQLLVNSEAEKTLREGKDFLESCIQRDSLRVEALYKEEPAIGRGNDIVLCEDGQLLPMLRSQTAAHHYHCLSDFFDEQQPSPIGMFVVTARPKTEPADEEERLMTHALCARLAEAAAEWLGERVKSDSSLFTLHSSLLRVAFGYATCPDHSLKRIVFDRLEAEQRLGITLTDHYSIQPSTSVCGLFINHPEATYFPVGRIDREQLADYCQRRGISIKEGEQLLSKFISS